MPQGDAYKIRRSAGYEKKLKQKSAGAKAAVEEAENAIADKPHKPQPEEDYPGREIPTSATLTQMNIAMPVYSLEIKKTGIMVTYTVLEYEKTVLMEDIEQSWRSQLGIHPE